MHYYWLLWIPCWVAFFICPCRSRFLLCWYQPFYRFFFFCGIVLTYNTYLPIWKCLCTGWGQRPTPRNPSSGFWGFRRKWRAVPILLWLLGLMYGRTNPTPQFLLPSWRNPRKNRPWDFIPWSRSTPAASYLPGYWKTMMSHPVQSLKHIPWSPFSSQLLSREKRKCLTPPTFKFSRERSDDRFVSTLWKYSIHGLRKEWRRPRHARNPTVWVWCIDGKLAPFEQNEQQPWNGSTSSQNSFWKQERRSHHSPFTTLGRHFYSFSIFQELKTTLSPSLPEAGTATVSWSPSRW